MGRPIPSCLLKSGTFKRVAASWVPVAGWQISNTYPLFGRWEGNNWLRLSQHKEKLEDLHSNLPILLEDMQGTCEDKRGKCGVHEGDHSNELWTKHNIQQLAIQAPQSNTNFPRCPVQPSWDCIWHPRFHLEDKHILPDLVCICDLQETVDELDRVLVLDPNSQLLSYNTTFKLGDFYVSPLISRHTHFKETPCISAMFLIHKHKFAKPHQEMFKEYAKRIPSLRKVNSPLVTDKESAIKSELPAVAILHC